MTSRVIGAMSAIGCVVASVPEKMVMEIYESVSAITDPKVPACMKSLVNGKDAETAYEGFLTFTNVVKKSQVRSVGPPARVPTGDQIGEAAKQLSDASYSFFKDLDWFKMIVMGVKADGNALKAVAETHHKTIGSIDASGVISAADYEAVNAALCRVVASVPKSTVVDIYNSVAALDEQLHP